MSINLILAAGIAAVMIAVGIYVYLRNNRTESAGWSAGPIISGKNYSPNVVVDSTGSFTFPTQDGIHYLTEACGDLTGKTTIQVHYRITADPGVTFVASSDNKSPGIGPAVYIQRKGDNWSGTGVYEGYRWWWPNDSQLTGPGDFTLEVSLTDPTWTSVEGQSGPDVFAAAKADPDRIGLTFGGGTGLGHGMYASGKAQFELISFTIV